MNRTLGTLVTICYCLIIIFVNVTALLFFLTALGGWAPNGGNSGSLLGIAGAYALLYHLVAIFAPAFIAVSLGNLLRRIAGFTPAFLLRMFWVEAGGMMVFFVVLLLMRYYAGYR